MNQKGRQDRAGTPALKPSVARLWRLRRSLAFVWRSGPRWAVANALVILVQGFLPLLFLYAIKLIVDLVTATIAGGPGTGTVDDEQFRQLVLFVGLAGGVAILQSLCTAAGRLIGEAQAQAVTDYMYGILHGKSIEVDLSYYENPVNRDTLHRAQRQAPYRPGRIVGSLLEFSRNGLSLLVMAGLLISYHWSVIPILVVASLPGVLLRLRYSSHYYSWELRATPRERLSAYTNRILTTDEFAKELRLFGLGKMFRGRFQRLREELRKEKLAVTTKRSIAEFTGEALAVLGVFGVLGFMGYSALVGTITVGSLIMYHGGLQRAWSHLGQMLRSVSDLFEDNLFITDLFDFLEVEPHVRTPAKPKPLPSAADSGLYLKNVSFRYPHDERVVLQGVDLDIQPGQHVALVGHNGSGKTTLVKLICRLYDPTHGSIRLGNTDLRDLDLAEHRKHIGILMQDYCRYQMTVRENVWLGNIDSDQHNGHIGAAVNEAGARPIVDRLSEGLDSMLGTTFRGGHELSTGQWQKIALARMLAKDAEILVLDEPTSAMDAEAEEQLIRKLREVAIGRTTLLISHRLAAVKELDRIVYLEGGVVAESGTHDELMALGGGYAHLFELQSKHYR